MHARSNQKGHDIFGKANWLLGICRRSLKFIRQEACCDYLTFISCPVSLYCPASIFCHYKQIIQLHSCIVSLASQTAITAIKELLYAWLFSLYRRQPTKATQPVCDLPGTTLAWQPWGLQTHRGTHMCPDHNLFVSPSFTPSNSHVAYSTHSSITMRDRKS